MTSDCLGGWYEAWWLSKWGLKPDVLEFDQVPGMGFKRVTLAPEPPVFCKVGVATDVSVVLTP